MDTYKNNSRKRKLEQIGKQTVVTKSARLIREKGLLSIPEYETELNQSESFKECLKTDPKEMKDGDTGTYKASGVFARNDSGYSTDDGDDVTDESDIIITNDVNISMEQKPPKSISARSTWTRLSGDSPVEDNLFKFGDLKPHSKIFGLIKKNPGSHEMSRLRIKHEHQDSEDGDEFGATLLTHKSEFMSLEIRQHFLVDLEAKGPADKMRIKNNDELILVDGIFVPEKTHAEVVDIFHHAKVDGKTRFQMVIRRAIPYDKEKSRSKQKKKWQWIETSAILAPDAKAILHKQPDVCDVELKELPKNEYCTYVYKRYRTKNRGLFIDINDGGLKACVQRNTSGDRSKILVRTSRVTSNEEGILGYYAALSDINMKRYISVENNEVTLGGQPCWFGYDATSTDVHLKKDNNFLSCDESTGHLNIVPDEFEFVEVTVNAGRDCLDYGCQAARKITAYCSSNSEYSSSNGIHQQGFNNSMETEGALDCPDGTMSIIREHSLCSDSSKCSTAMEVD